MRIAIISDIHANYVALEAALRSLEAERVDRIVCLGDVAATGPQPHQVIDRLKELNCPAIMGNADAFLLNLKDPVDADDNTRRIAEIDLWCSKQLTGADSDYIRSFLPRLEMPLDGGVMLCFHGSPKSNTDTILSTTPDEDLERMLSDFDAKIMAGGHTHVQMLRRHKDSIIINPGSVGLPYELVHSTGQVRNPPWAEYAIVDWISGNLKVEFRHVSLDANAVIQAALDSGMPHAEWWAKDWR